MNVASILVVPKQTVPGKKNLPIRTRWHVRWERGRGRPVVHLGVYDTKTRAEKRRRTALDQLARGEIPSNDPIVEVVSEPLRVVADRWLERRIGIKESTRLSKKASMVHIAARFGDDDPHAITVDEIQDWIATMSETAKRGTIKNRVGTLKLILKHAKVKPNPADDDELELPRAEPKRNRLPSKRALEAFYTDLARIAGGKYTGVVKLMEYSGLRVSEAVAVRYEDWDRAKRRLLIPDSKTFAGERFIDQIDGLPEMPPRGEGRVWTNVTVDGVQAAVATACRRTGIPLFSPHDLRRLHISRQLRDGADPILVSVRAGHSSTNITLGTYAKLVPPE